MTREIEELARRVAFRSRNDGVAWSALDGDGELLVVERASARDVTVVAVNLSASAEVYARFEVRDGRARARARVLFEDRLVPVRHGVYEDRLAPWDARIFVLHR